MLLQARPPELCCALAPSLRGVCAEAIPCAAMGVAAGRGRPSQRRVTMSGEHSSPVRGAASKDGRTAKSLPGVQNARQVCYHASMNQSASDIRRARYRTMSIALLAAASVLVSVGAWPESASGNDVAYWATPAGERFAIIGMSDDGQTLLVESMDSNGGAVFGPEGLKRRLTAPYSPTDLRWISGNGKWAAGSSGEQAALWTVETGALELTGGFDHFYPFTVDNNGTMAGNLANDGDSLGNQAFRRTLNGPIEQLMPGYVHSSVMATSASGSVLALLAYQVSGGPTRAFYFTGTGPAVELPSAVGETYTCPRAVIEVDGWIIVVGENGTLYYYKPFVWIYGDLAKTTLPALGVRKYGSALCVAGRKRDEVMSGGSLRSTSSDRKAIFWLPDGEGGLVARDAEQLARALAPELVALKLTTVVGLSPDRKHALIEAVDSFSSPTVCRGIVLNLWYSTPLGTVKAQPLSSPVSVTTAPVIASYPDAGVFYIENMDRSAGIRVNAPGHSVKLGDKVSLTGTLDEVGGEKCVSAQSADIFVFPGQYPLPRPLVVSNGQVGTSVGLCNTGLLVRSYGRLVDVGPGYFVIDDGSLREGLKALTTGASISLPPIGAFMCVTGVSSRSDSFPALWLRSQGDISLP